MIGFALRGRAEGDGIRGPSKSLFETDPAFAVEAGIALAEGPLSPLSLLSLHATRV